MITAAWVTFKVCTIIGLAGLMFAWLCRAPAARWVKSRGIPVMMGLFAIGMLSPSYWLVYAAMGGLIPILSRNRSEAVALYMLELLGLPALGHELGVGSIYILLLDKYLFGAIGMGIALIVHPARGRAPRGTFDIPFLLLMLLEVVQVRELNVTQFLRMETNLLLSLIIPYFAIRQSLRSPEDAERMLTAISFGGFVLSAIAFYEARSSFLVYDAITNQQGLSGGISGYTHQRSGSLRAVGPFLDATSFGYFLAVALLLTLPLRDIFRAKRFWLTALFGILVGLYSTNARGAAIAAVIGLLAYDIYRRRYTSLAAKMGLMGLAFAMALLVAQFNTKVAERLGVSGAAMSTSDYRKQLARRGFEEIRKHPFVGMSHSEMNIAMADMRQGEGFVDYVNGYVLYGLQLGYGGIVGLLGAFLMSAWKAWDNRRFLQARPRWLEIGAVVFGISLFTAVTTYTSGYGGRMSIYFYMVLALGSAVSSWRYDTRFVKVAAGVPAPVEPRSRSRLPATVTG